MKLKITVDETVYEVDVEVLEDAPAAMSGGGYAAAAVRASSAGAVKVPSTAPKIAAENLEEGKVARSPVHGLVVKVIAKVGQSIQPNDTLIVLEAMKMESAVTAPAAGTVKEIRVKTGDKVETGQVLVVLE